MKQNFLTFQCIVRISTRNVLGGGARSGVYSSQFIPIDSIIIINLLTPNVNYSGRTASLTSTVSFYIFIQQIYVLNILNMVYILRIFLFKMQFVS